MSKIMADRKKATGTGGYAVKLDARDEREARKSARCFGARLPPRYASRRQAAPNYSSVHRGSSSKYSPRQL